MKQLIERLHEEAMQDGLHHETISVIKDATNALEAMTAERDAQSKLIDSLKGDVQELDVRCEALRAEIAKMLEQEPCYMAISYDGKTPYQLFCQEDCNLLDAEVSRIGGTAQKMPLYAAPGAQP